LSRFVTNGSASAARVCVIGAGTSGLTASQVLAHRGIEFDCFEKGSKVGGNWRYHNDNGMSAAYRSLSINASRRIMEFASYPMSDELPDYPHHSHIAAYFDEYADRFGLRERIRFNAEVKSVEPSDEGGWKVELDDGECRRYAATVVANGHHWSPRWPDPPIPGPFAGEVLHAHSYDTPEPFADKRVCVVGFGNSAVDIATEVSRVSSATYLSIRRGAHVLPKYVAGVPVDELGLKLARYAPLSLQRLVSAPVLRIIQGAPRAYGLPSPDHKLGEAQPTVSSEVLGRIGHGQIMVKPRIHSLEGDAVRFHDGSIERVDAIVYCTGYEIRFPFLSSTVLNPRNNRIDLFRRVVHPDWLGLYFIGLIQPLGAVMRLCEAQAHWVADLLEGRATLPSAPEMHQHVEREWARMQKRYVRSDRHTIQVDFHPYLRELARARRYRRGRDVSLPRSQRRAGCVGFTRPGDAAAIRSHPDPGGTT
jgi:dimethylaniline monooxygenase (N-oxide forming)